MKGQHASPTSRRGHKITLQVWEEVPVFLRYQRYQFTQITGSFRKRSFRSELRVKPPQDPGECHGQLKQLAQDIHLPNGSVDVEDLVQIGEIALLEQTRDWEKRGIQPPPKAWQKLLTDARRAMFHAIDQHSVTLGSQRDSRTNEAGGDEIQDLAARLSEAGFSRRSLQKQYGGLEQAFARWDMAESDWFQNVPGAACNWTVFRRGNDWEFFDDVAESWTAPLPPGSCRPRKALHCEDPRHLPLVHRFWGGEALRTFACLVPAYCAGERGEIGVPAVRHFRVVGRTSARGFVRIVCQRDACEQAERPATRRRNTAIFTKPMACVWLFLVLLLARPYHPGSDARNGVGTGRTQRMGKVVPALLKTRL
jgi:hypothetical protein